MKPIPNTCPECWHHITCKEGTLKGEILKCPSCAVELEVIQVDPIVLAEAPKMEIDWGE